MRSLFWYLVNRTTETEFIFNLFHLLLAGLTLLVLLYQLRAVRRDPKRAPDRFLLLGFLLIVLHFALLGLYFGASFYFGKEFRETILLSLSHGLLGCGVFLVVLSYVRTWRARATDSIRWAIYGCVVIITAVCLDLVFPHLSLPPAHSPHSAILFGIDVLALLAVGFGFRAAAGCAGRDRRANLFALGSLGAALLLHTLPVVFVWQTQILVWNAEQHALSFSLFAFAWAVGERSANLLDRVFVRLNLTFIVLASLIMLFTAGMEKYQYLHLAQERSMDLAEFLRGHITYYEARGEDLDQIFRRPEVLRRVIVEFGTLPELRDVDVYVHGKHARFRRSGDWEIKREFTASAESPPEERSSPHGAYFQMIRLPIRADDPSNGRIELLGTIDYINKYIGNYIILIYSLFTIMVALGTGIIGIIVTDTDRRLRRQYAELQETQEQLAHAAKLASVGELAGGMAHEINNPVTSILSLCSHMAEGKDAQTLAPQQRQNLRLVVRQAERVSKIVRNLLTFSRHSRLELSRLELSTVLEAAATLVDFRLKERGVVLRKEWDGDLPVVVADAGRLTEVFVNVFNNAIDAMPEGGTLRVRAVPQPPPETGVRVEVQDTGTGIEREHLARIFDPFFTTKEPGHGTGLGLSISHGIIKDHGGRIWAESQPQSGTRVMIILPSGA